jgi:hypothetical protein
MKRFATALSALVLLLSAPGCQHQISGGPAPGVDMARFKTFYVVTDKTDNEVARALEKDLGARGLGVTTGLDWAIPSDAQVKVVFQEKWSKDITRYLQDLAIEMSDAHSGAMLASGRCHRTSTVRKPVAEMVKEITDRIFHSPPPPPPPAPSPPA